MPIKTHHHVRHTAGSVLMVSRAALSTNPFAFTRRDALKHFPLAPSNPEEDGSGNGADDSVSEPGCCSLCERLMPLTRHHVMPK